MATIIKRPRRDGSVAWRAEVRIMRDGQQVFRAVKTFDTRPAARTWATKIEAEWEDSRHTQRPAHTLAQLIEAYIERMDQAKPLGDSTRSLLRAIQRSKTLGPIAAADLTAADIIAHCQNRRTAGAGPSTVILDYSTLRTLFKAAKPLLGLNLDDTAFQEARHTLTRLGLIARPRKRGRIPTHEELQRLLSHARKRMKHAGTLIPMADIIEFAIYSCMRCGEICRIRWADLDPEKRTVIIRDRKHPQAKWGNDHTIPLLGPAFDIAARQPRDSDRIFPYDSASVSTAFTRMVEQLEIQDLEFRDLRRHGATLLFLQGYTPPEVATVTGHHDLNILWQVYTAIKPEHLHEKHNGLRPPTPEEKPR